MTRSGWGDAMKRALFSGSVASVASTMALALCGRRDVRSAVTPLNGPSQWVWGSAAPYEDGFSVRHTLVGYAIHHLASVFWPPRSSDSVRASGAAMWSWPPP